MIPRMKRTLLAALALFAALAAAAAPPHYHVVRHIKVGGEGGWDYLTSDPDAKRLYITRGTHVMVLDEETGKVVGDIPKTEGVHGVAIAPKLHRGFISNGRSNTMTIFDTETLKTIDEVKTGERPDAILFDDATGRVFTFNAGTKNATAFDAKTGAALGAVALDAKPETATSDGKGQIFVNLEDKNTIAVIDANKLTVTKTWPLAPCEEPSGMAIDRKSHRLFAGCGNKMMAIMNYDDGKVVATVPIGDGVDANGFDPALNLAFSSNGEGTLTVVSEVNPNKFEVVENVPTKRGARTMALDTKTHHVFTVTADFGPPPAPTPDRPRPRPPMLPDTFEVIELAP
jgi:YVTN family beta-propeller protein